MVSGSGKHFEKIPVLKMDEGFVNKDKLKMADLQSTVNVFDYSSDICRHDVKRKFCRNKTCSVAIFRDPQSVNFACQTPSSLSLLDEIHMFRYKLHGMCDQCFDNMIRTNLTPSRKELFIRIFSYRPLPLDHEWPQWAWEIQAIVDKRRNNCREAVMTILLFIQPGNPTRSRDVMTMIAKRVWETRFNEEWEK